MMIIISRVILVTCALFWIGCGAATIEKPVSPAALEEIPRTPDEMRSQMKLLFPENGAIPGWRKTGEIDLFDKSTLYEHIDGAAEAFFAYDFQLCGTAEYNPDGDANEAPASSEDTFILVDVYDMGRPINAFGMYASELSESKPVDVGVQGYMETSVLNFWKGPYYVKIISSKEDEVITKANMEIAKYIAQKILWKAENPSMLSLLPTEGLRPGTERFILNSILGYSFLKNGVTAKYKLGDEEKSLIIVECESDNDSKDIFTQFADYEEKTSGGVVKIIGLGEEGFVANDKYYKRLIVVRQGRYLIIAMAVTDESAARDLIRKAIGNIKSPLML